MRSIFEHTRALASELAQRAYGIGRRSWLAQAVFMGLRHMRVAAKPPYFVEDELNSLIHFVRTNGGQFQTCREFCGRYIPRGVSFRYDVHVRDIDACHAFIEAHRSHGVPATFFLLSDYSNFERSYAVQFASLANKIAAPLEIGLHDSPVDAYLINTRFGGDRERYRVWLNSDNVLEWLLRLADDEHSLAAFNADVLSDFAARVGRLKRSFGAIATVACHGGELVRMVRERQSTLGPELQRLAGALLAKEWLTPQRVAAAGLEACVDDFGSTGANRRQLSDGGGQIIQLVARLNRFFLQKRMAVQLLLHPFTWGGAKRDGELSLLLNQSRSAKQGTTACR